MSIKNTPINKRINKFNNLHLTPTNSLRKRILKTTDDVTTSNMFNTAFSLPSSATKTPLSSTKKKIIPSTTINSCYTPSSLYRSAGSTPSRYFSSCTATPKTPQNSYKKLAPDCFPTKVSIEATNSASSNRKCSSSSRGKSILTSSEEIKNKDSGEISNLTVAVRVRPLNSKECLNTASANIVHVDNDEVTVLAGTTADSSAGVSHSFQYDHAFWSANLDDRHYADQQTVFRGTGMPLIEKAFQGYNACLFAYGQTGSGKSYSMMGIENDNDTNNEISKNSEAGIIPRFCHELFRRIELNKNTIQAEIEVSYFEIYNEKIHDLLCVTAPSFQQQQSTEVSAGFYSNQNHHKNALKVREHPVWGPYVVDLSTHPVDSYSSLRNWLAVGNSQRATAATGMNDKSSRSHSIFNIVLNLSELEECSNSTNKIPGKNNKKIKQTKRSKISLVDLAGSERINHYNGNGNTTTNTTTANSACGIERIREGVSINKSLLTLGKVIAALADFNKKSNASTFVPYRESVLTWLLRENLGGNSRTVMLATISPANIHIDETLATLRYACQARTIVNRVKVNEDPHDKIIRELRAEVERLQALRQDYERQQKRHSVNDNLLPRKIIIETSSVIDESEVDALRQQLAETEKELEKEQKSWLDRLKEAENLRKTEIRMLKRKGLAMEFSVEQKQSCLVNLAADPILSGTLFYILPPGLVRIGRARPSAFSQPDIVLDGPLVAYHHCSIENSNGSLFIIPENDETYLNGELLDCHKKKQIYHGDRLVIGGSHYFRISNPNCFNKNKNSNSVVVDYQLAHQEILQKQEDALRLELNKEKQAALDQIEIERAANEKNYIERMELLELERFKFNCNKELLETEKEAFEKAMITNKNDEIYTPSYNKSTKLLDEIKNIMQHPSDDDNLHQIQLKVKEATQRCRDVGLIYDFKQSQVLDEFGIFRAVVSIIDKENRRKTEWPTARLDVWLDIVRDTDDIDRSNIFNCVDLEWKPISNNEQLLNDTINESLNSSRRISLNLSSVIKEAILKEPNDGFQKFRNMIMSSSLSSSSHKKCDKNKKENLNRSAVMNLSSSVTRKNQTKKMLTYDDDDLNEKNISSQCSSSTPNLNLSETNQKSPLKITNENNFSSTAYVYLKDIQRSTLKFKKLCESFESNENYNNNNKRTDFNYCKKSIEQIEMIIFDLKASLTEQKLSGSPTKTPKSVRFLLD